MQNVFRMRSSEIGLKVSERKTKPCWFSELGKPASASKLKVCVLEHALSFLAQKKRPGKSRFFSIVLTGRCRRLSVQFILYREAKLFVDGRYLNSSEVIVGGPVIASKLGKSSSVQGLKTPVEIVFRVNQHMHVRSRIFKPNIQLSFQSSWRILCYLIFFSIPSLSETNHQASTLIFSP